MPLVPVAEEEAPDGCREDLRFEGVVGGHPRSPMLAPETLSDTFLRVLSDSS